MKKLLVITLATSALLGCKAQGPIKSSDDSSGDFRGIKNPVARNFTQTELQIGKRICNALKTKRLEFGNLSTEVVHQFRFRGEIKKCNGQPYNSGIFVADVKNDSADYEYVATKAQEAYFKDVITDESSVIKVICTNLSVSDSVANAVLIDNASYGVNLLVRDGYDRFEIVKRTNTGITSSESVNLITMAAQAQNKHYGVEKERIRNVVCPGSKDFSYIKQTWIEAVAGF